MLEVNAFVHQNRINFLIINNWRHQANKVAEDRKFEMVTYIFYSKAENTLIFYMSNAFFLLFCKKSTYQLSYF